MEDLQARHRKEQRELQGRITQKKKNATKKTRKGVHDECERLERELQERQQTEIQVLESTSIDNKIANLEIQSSEDESTEKTISTSNDDKSLEDGTATVALRESNMDQPRQINEAQEASKKPSRQKARLARRAAEQDALVKAASEEAKNLPDRREQEVNAMKIQMEKRGLIEIMIRPDGHCLYSACALSIPSDSTRTYKDVRADTAKFILGHSDDFAPFLEEPLHSYASKIRDTAEWGGHLELQAIARTYEVDIHVLRANGQVDTIRSNKSASTDETIWLAYYEHSFGLGEHYNALKKT